MKNKQIFEKYVVDNELPKKLITEFNKLDTTMDESVDINIIPNCFQITNGNFSIVFNLFNYFGNKMRRIIIMAVDIK